MSTIDNEREATIAALIALGLTHDDLDDACLAVQYAIGTSDGGLASIHFSGLDDDDDWRDLFATYVRAEFDADERHAAICSVR